MALRSILRASNCWNWTSGLSVASPRCFTTAPPEDDSQGVWHDDGQTESSTEKSFGSSNEYVNSVKLRGDITGIYQKNGGAGLNLMLKVKYFLPDMNTVDGNPKLPKSQTHRIDFYGLDSPWSKIVVPEIEIGDNVTVYSNIYHVGDSRKVLLKGYYVVKHE